MFIIDKVQKIVLALTATLCASVIATVSLTRPDVEDVKEHFLPWFDSEAVEGNPEISDESTLYSTLEIPLTSGSCKVSMDAAPKLNGDELDVYFTNLEENNVGIKLVIYDESENIIGESGIIKTGEYVKSVKLNNNTTGGNRLKAKILTYEDETYYSLGSAGAVLVVR